MECQPTEMPPHRRGPSEDSAAWVVMSVGHSAVSEPRTLLLGAGVVLVESEGGRHSVHRGLWV